MTGPLAPTGTTKVCGVIGDPVSHSLSPVLHNAAYAALGLDWVYVAFAVATGNGAEAVAAMRALGLVGLSVTMPHKESIARYADEVSDDVVALGAGNTLRWVGTNIRAETTDGPGCISALREAGVDPTGKRVMVLGAGGAGRAVVLALAREGAKEIVVVNRTPERARAAVALTGAIGRVGSADEADRCDVVINATSVGMAKSSDGIPVDRAVIDPARLGPGQVVNDLVYHPLVTPLMAMAAERGSIVVGGLGMLLHQAALQFRFWTGESAPIDAMRAAVSAELARRSA